MIVEIIILASIALTLAFIVAWLLRPELRRRIEGPKHAFQDQLRAYNRGIRDPGEHGDPKQDEPI
ncbi:MAG: hypothetical protein OEV41_13305 [Gammaproteobacteria bacterium]|nr:hypothetical protein [Gammaproteobacteria bacterium]